MANLRNAVMYNKSLPNLFHAKVSQFALIFLSKINRNSLPLDQAAKSGGNFPESGIYKTHLVDFAMISTK
ncbi:MAG: hypothetical protein LBB26_00090 [Puniceicoccales bacterium]|jgi:hypothetical protein|nr:hypothetical protein [Puniceicoccales bacterium]